MFKRINKRFVLSAITIAVLACATYLTQPIVSAPNAQIITIESGSSLGTIVKQLPIRGRWVFKVLAYASGQSRRIHAGIYALKQTQTPWQLLTMFSRGDVLRCQFIIKPGESLTEIIPRLNAQKYLKGVLQFEPSKEGWLKPDTYQYAAGSERQAIIERAIEAMRAQLETLWAGRASGLVYKNPAEALIAASIIEKETAIDSERSLIASIIQNRIKKSMRLQMDPTVLYGLGGKAHRPLTKSKLKIPTPYNTYLNKGLPPTPIANPSFKSLYSALHPAQSQLYYFKAVSGGRHVFSKTLASHNKVQP